MQKVFSKFVSVLSLVTGIMLFSSCEKQEISPSISPEKQSATPKALILALKGADSTGLYKVLISYRSPISEKNSKGILSIVSNNGYTRKLNFSDVNFDMELNLKEKGIYTFSILDISEAGNDYVESSEITIK
jgi:hypothetical protein